jgi:hypothetical protein
MSAPSREEVETGDNEGPEMYMHPFAALAQEHQSLDSRRSTCFNNITRIVEIGRR